MLKIRPFLELFLIAAIGASGAVIVDFTLSTDGSLLHSAAGYIDAAAAFVAAPQIPFRAVAAVLVLLGACSVFYLRPLSRKGAFACGFAAIATLAIFTP